jgi:hypothetical protein
MLYNLSTILVLIYNIGFQNIVIVNTTVDYTTLI